MDNYLVLHIDIEFIAAIVCTRSGRSFPIQNGNEDLLWLYFFNDPYKNMVSFGKDNKVHVNNLEMNYYGNFSNLITDESSKFILRGNNRPIIELLEYSGLLSLLIENFKNITLESSVDIPTLITFSSSISDYGKVKIIQYLSSKDFDIKSYTIPLPELISVHYWNENRIKAKNGNVVLFLKATNTTLHLVKLTFADGYFLKDETCTIQEKGKGYDPRKKSIVNFVVNEINKSTAVLSNQAEIDKECERFESMADDWLRRMDSITGNRPANIRSISLSPAINMKKDVLIRKEDIESDTVYYINELYSIYTAFEKDAVKDRSSICSVILFGDCFNNDMIRKKFQNHVDNEQLIISTTRDLINVLPVYPKIDFNRYADEKERIAAHAKAEADEKAQKIALENERRGKEEIEFKKQDELRRTEKNKQKAKILLQKAIELEKEGSLTDAITNIENSKELDPMNKEILLYFDTLKEKKIKLDIKTEQYKKLLSEADMLAENKEYEDALNKFELAKSIIDNPDLRNKIVDIKNKFKEIENNKKKLQTHLVDADKFSIQKKYKEAKDEILKALILEPKNKQALTRKIEIEAFLKQQDSEVKKLVLEGDQLLRKKEYKLAIDSYNKALIFEPGNENCLAKIRHISDLVKQVERDKEVFDRVIKSANEFFENNEWINAKQQYEEALKVNPGDAFVTKKLDIIGFKIIEFKKKFDSLLKSADTDFDNKKYIEARNKYMELLKDSNENKHIKERLRTIKLKITFGTDDKKTGKLENIDETNWDFAKKDKEQKNDVAKNVKNSDKKNQITKDLQKLTKKTDNKFNF